MATEPPTTQDALSCGSGQRGRSQGPSIERRTLCIMCDGRCNPESWTCRRCHARVMVSAERREIQAALDDALAASKTSPTSRA